VLHNPGSTTFQLKLHVGEQQLEGELLCDQPRGYRYHIYQRTRCCTRRPGTASPPEKAERRCAP